jgi:SAM-dependent methyltransferase
VLEHLKNPREAIMEIHRVLKVNGLIAVSLPLENLFQRLSRVGFRLMKVVGDPILKKAKPVPITKTPEYHYVGDVKSYNGMVEALKAFFHPLYNRYTPVGLHRSININGVHVFQKRK